MFKRCGGPLFLEEHGFSIREFVSIDCFSASNKPVTGQELGSPTAGW